MQADQPNLLLSHDMNDLPRAPLRVKLLNAGPVGERLIPHRIDIPLGECAAVRAPDGLRQLRQRLLPFGLNVEALALPEVVAFQATPDNVDLHFLLGNAEIDAVVHHLAEGLELALRDVELDHLRGGHVRRPIEGLALITTDY